MSDDQPFDPTLGDEPNLHADHLGQHLDQHLDQHPDPDAPLPVDPDDDLGPTPVNPNPDTGHSPGQNPDPAASSAASSEGDPEAAEAMAAAVSEALAPAVADGRAAGQIPEAWEVEDYLATGNDSAAAAKLADSAVAPLVAMARGYETIHQETFAEAYRKYPMPRKQTLQGKRLSEAVTRGDLLIMPWYTHDDIVTAERSNRTPKPLTIQVRPSRPELNDKGKEIKYEFVGGQRTPIGMHPAYPTSWIDTTPVVLLAEGMLKGDSAITGYLLAHGVTRDELAWKDSDNLGTTREDNIRIARTRLAGLLERIDPDQRILVLTIGGVDNWKNNPEWRTIDMKQRLVWLGIDGDVSSNPNVWRAASELWDFLKEKKKSTPMLLAPVVAPGSADEKKVGIDDYLSRHGNWEGLVAMLASGLPKRPEGTNVEYIGQHKISEDGTSLLLCKPVSDPYNPDGPPIKGEWEEVLPLGGRILSLVAHRSPTPDEVATGELGKGADNDIAPWDVEVELSWKDPNDDKIVHRHVISGPANILNYTPDQWDRHKAQIPAPILRSPEWPPSKKVGEEWLRALKAHRPEDTAIRVRWETMGWVPVDGGIPAFVIGDQVIGGDDEPDIDIFAGVGEGELPGASRFGVGEEDPRDFFDEDYREQVRADIEKTLDGFVNSGAWRDRKVASTIVAAALRPVLPVRPNATIFCVGPPSKGKSYSAAMMMGFWSRRPGDFTGSSLPGSAKDTAAAMETAVSRSPIWVVDDLAPASSRQQSEQEQNRIADLVRNVFNGSGKRRSTVDMGVRKVNTPRALLVVTAENELQVGSARDRCITLNIGHGALAGSPIPTDQVDHLCSKDGAPARVTQALIKYLRHVAKQCGKWEVLHQQVVATIKASQSQAEKRMQARGAVAGQVKRHAGLAGDIASSLLWLRRLAEEVGVREEIAALLRGDQMMGDIFDLMAQGHRENSNSSPGKALIEAIGGALFQKRCHILDAQTPAHPPGDDQIATRLGWEVGPDGNSRPKGDTIGWLVRDKVHGEVLYIDQKAAFAIAQREYPSLVPPGQGQRSSWASVAGEKLVVDDLCRPTGDGRRMTTGRRRDDAVLNEISGTPVRLSIVLNRGEEFITEQRDPDAA